MSHSEPRRLSRSRFRIAVLAAFLTVVLAPPAHAALVTPASMEFSPASYDFGPKVPATGPSQPKTFTLTNTGEFDLSIKYVYLAWGPPEAGDPEIFKMTSDGCLGTLAVGASCGIDVAFNPQLPGNKWGELTVTAPFGNHCNEKGEECKENNVSAEARMVGTARTIAVSPPTLSFLPFTVAGGPSPAKTVTFTNEGETSVTVHNVILTNHEHFQSDQFRLVGGTCAPTVTLLPKDSCTAQVAFAPTKVGHLSGDLAILDSAVGGEQYATLEGEGVPPAIGPQPPAEARVLLSHRPPRLTRKRTAVFRFSGMGAAPGFECRLDSGAFAPCESPVRFGHLKLGHHHFAVRQNESGSVGPATHYRWTVEPRR